MGTGGFSASILKQFAGSLGENPTATVAELLGATSSSALADY